MGDSTVATHSSHGHLEEGDSRGLILEPPRIMLSCPSRCTFLHPELPLLTRGILILQPEASEGHKILNIPLLCFPTLTICPRWVSMLQVQLLPLGIVRLCVILGWEIFEVLGQENLTVTNGERKKKSKFLLILIKLWNTLVFSFSPTKQHKEEH